MRLLPLLPFLFPSILCYDILFNGMHSSSSHIGSCMPTAVSMVSAGHNVHYLSSDVKEKGYAMPPSINHTYIQLRMGVSTDIVTMLYIPMWKEFIGLSAFPMVWIGGEKALLEMREEHFDEITPFFNRSFDLVVADELFAVSSYALAMRNRYAHGKAYAVMSTTVPAHLISMHMSLGHNTLHRPSFYVHPSAPYDPTKFNHRVKTFWDGFFNGLNMELVTRIMTQTSQRLFEYDFTFQRFMQGATIQFFDDIDYFAYPAPIGHDTIHVGMRCPAAKDLTLPDLYEKFINTKESKGTIYIAFGTNVPWKYAPKSTTDSFIHALNRLTDYRIIFAFNGESHQLEGTGEHILVSKWAPQKEILAHPSTKLFVTHGGLKSLKESLCSAVPALFKPMFAEQTHNADVAVKMGFARVLDKSKISADLLYGEMKAILDTPSYASSASRMRDIMLDRPVDANQLVQFHTRRVISRHSVLDSFKRRGQFLSILQHIHAAPIAGLAILVAIISH